MYKYKFLQVGQLPREHLSFLQNPLNFFITKYLKHEVNKSLTNQQVIDQSTENLLLSTLLS